MFPLKAFSYIYRRRVRLVILCAALLLGPTLPVLAFESEASVRETYAYSRTLLNPDPICPEFVQARHLDAEGGAGLGHSFMSFHYLIHVASIHNVTVKGRYTSSGHSINSSLVDAFFFGDYFDVPLPRPNNDPPTRHPNSSVNISAVASSVPEPTGDSIKVVECITVEDFTRTLAINRAQGCINKTVTIYNIDTPMRQWSANIDTHLFREAYARNRPYRDAYVARLSGLDERTSTTQDAASQNKDNKCIKVAVHIRRGDIARESLARRFSSRWVPNRAYLQVIDAVHQSLSKIRPAGELAALGQRRPCSMCIELYVEGAASPAKVPDLDPDNMRGHTNFQDRLAQYGSVSVVASDAITSFARACSADILITGKSGYSYLMSLLCGSPVILAFPSFFSYENVPNAMMVSTAERNRTWITGATLNETHFLALTKQQGLTCG